jgi:ATP-binding cassette subfamily B protein
LLALVPFLTKYRGMLLLMGAAILLSAAAMLSVPLAARRMIDLGFSSADSSVINRTFGLLMLIGAMLAAASSTRFYAVNWLGERVIADLRSAVFAHLVELSPAFYEKTHSGEVMSRLTADTTQIKAAAGSSISQFLRNAIMLIGALVMMVVTSLKLTLLVLLAIPLIVLPLMAFGRAVRSRSRRAQDSLAEASAFAADNLSAVRTMQASGNGQAVASRFALAVGDAFEAAMARIKARAGLTALVIFLTFASVVGVLWYGASDVVAGQMTGGTLSQFVLYALFAAGAVAELAEVWGEVQQAAGAAERLSELMAAPIAIRSPAEPKPLPEPAKGALAFENVTFAYDAASDEPVLKDVSFAVAPGETVAIVGPSGAGKSTLFNLALRFFDPQSGRVTVDGVDVATADLTALRRRFAVVPQDIAVFADTVEENIRYGMPAASDTDVRRAAKAAEADEFIRALPQGYATRLGERGITLSGGQRQRIAIARALLRNAPILLLDEATSALDAESEHAVQTALADLMRGRTTLVIAHRLATVQRASRILVMDEGRIIEHGSHAELLGRGGLYRRLSELQFRAEAAE